MRYLALLFLVLVCLAIAPYSSQTTPQQQAIQIKGIKDRVTIRRDERGIPYIEAQNDEDLYFGQGYATAAVVGAFPLDARFGLSRGFRLYDQKYPQGAHAYVRKGSPEDLLREVETVLQ